MVISEKWDKKASKYGLEAVPHGFTGSKAIYEASMRHPLGRDYNTTSAFRNMTRPEILKDTGILINPVKYSKPSSDAGVDGLKKRDAVGPRGSKDLVKRARLRQ